MPTNQPIPSKLLFAIFKTKYPFPVIGLVFIVLSLFVLTPIITYFNSTKNAYEKYDHEKIMSNGKDLPAIIDGVDIQYNVTINRNHPMVIDYTYEADGQQHTDHFKTLMNSYESTLHVGDSIPIKVYNNQSVLKDFEPFSFPVYIFYFVPALFLALGIALLLVGLVPVIKHRQLYKNGQRVQATIIAITATSSLPFLSSGQHAKVSYIYPGQHGNRIIGTSVSPGLYLLAEKKPQDSIDIFVSPGNENLSCIVPKEWM